MCCKLLAIAELEKPRNEWCPHCQVGVGCSIYGAKPNSCSEFSCLWLLTPWLPEDARPDRTGVVMFTPEGEPKSLQVHVDPHRASAWEAGIAGRVVDAAVGAGMRALITIGDRRKLWVREDLASDTLVKFGEDLR